MASSAPPPSASRPTLTERPLRLMLYDRTCTGRWGLPGLTASWRVGALWHRWASGLDLWHGAASWEEGLAWLAEAGGTRPIEQIQYWGHGQPGTLLLDRVPLTRAALGEGHPLRPRLARIRERLAPGGEALWWFRTCSTFADREGHAFARDWTRFFGCRAAGHTWIIGPLQGGLHTLRPGEEPAWPLEEREPSGGLLPPWLRPGAPRLVTCLHGRIPPDF